MKNFTFVAALVASSAASAHMRAVPRVSAAIPAVSASAASPSALSAAPAAFHAPAAAAARPQLLEDRLIVPTILHEADSVRMIAIRSEQPLESTASRVDEYFDGSVASGALADAKLELSGGELRMRFAGSHDGVNRAAEDFRKLTSVTQRLPAGKSRLFRDSLLPVGAWNPKVALLSDVTKVLPPGFVGQYSRRMTIEGPTETVREISRQTRAYLEANKSADPYTYVNFYPSTRKRPAELIIQIRADAETVDRLSAGTLRLAGLPARMEP